MSSSASISMRVPIWNPTLIGLDFPLAALIDIVRKRKILTYTQEI
jgi:ABC-type molybdate transport system ATPase subunit